jgi:ParB family chromosome partitioning protein
MATKKSGLEAIFGDDLKKAFDSIENFDAEERATDATIEVSKIKPNPYQPRTVFDEEKINELAQSIKQHGVFTPIIVKKDVSGYILVAGERRTRAAKVAGLKKIPAIIVEMSDIEMREVALLENIQREQLNAIEEAEALKELMDTLNLTQAKLAERVGKSRSYVANSLRLLDLPKKIRTYVLEGKISAGHAKAVAGLDDKELMVKLIERAIDEKLNVRKLEEIVKGYKLQGTRKTSKKKTKDDTYAYVEGLLRKRLGTKADLNRILELMGAID